MVSNYQTLELVTETISDYKHWSSSRYILQEEHSLGQRGAGSVHYLFQKTLGR